MRKTILALLVVLLMLASVFPLMASAVETDGSEYLKIWEINIVNQTMNYNARDELYANANYNISVKFEQDQNEIQDGTVGLVVVIEDPEAQVTVTEVDLENIDWITLEDGNNTLLFPEFGFDKEGTYKIAINVSADQTRSIGEDFWCNDSIEFDFKSYGAEFNGTPVVDKPTAKIDEDVTVTVEVNNTGAMEGNYTVNLTLEDPDGGEAVMSKYMAVAAGTIEAYDFVIDTDEFAAGEYEGTFALYMGDDWDTEIDTIAKGALFTLEERVGDLAGCVKNTDGEFLEGATVAIEGTALTTATNETGEYGFANVTIGTYNITATLAGYDVATEVDFVIIEDDNELNFTLDINTAHFWVAVMYGNMSIEGAKVTIDDTEYSNTTNESGAVVFWDLPLATYNITVNATGYVDVHKTGIVLDTDDKMIGYYLNFTEMYVPPIVDGKICGYVTDADNSSVFLSNVTIVIYSEVTTEVTEEVNGTNVTTNVTTTTYFNTTTNATGFYTSAKLLLGDYYIYPMLEGYEEVAPVMFTLTAAANMVDKNFTLKFIPPTYTLTVKVTPMDATVTVNGNAVEINNTTGEGIVENLLESEVTIKVTKDGYEPQEEKFNITADITKPFTLVELPPQTKDITLGPMKDEDGIAVAGATVTFTYDGTVYTATTDSIGNANFTIPGDASLKGVNITVKKGEETYSWLWQDETIPMFKGEETVDPASDGDDDDDESLLWLWILIGVIVVIIIVVIIIFVMKGGKKEKVEEASCPECGATVQTDMDACPECGYSFIEKIHACPECGEELEPDATMCDACGTEMVFASKEDREDAGQDLEDDIDLGEDEEEEDDTDIDDFEDDDDEDDDGDLDEDFEDDDDDLDDFDDE